MTEKAVIDRIVDGQYAVLLVGGDEREVILPANQLPQEASPGTWLQVEVYDDVVTQITVDPEETETTQRRIRGKLALLRERGGRLKRGSNQTTGVGESSDIDQY